MKKIAASPIAVAVSFAIAITVTTMLGVTISVNFVIRETQPEPWYIVDSLDVGPGIYGDLTVTEQRTGITLRDVKGVWRAEVKVLGGTSPVQVCGGSGQNDYDQGESTLVLSLEVYTSDPRCAELPPGRYQLEVSRTMIDKQTGEAWESPRTISQTFEMVSAERSEKEGVFK
ncbi:MAG: hypothetical protein R3C70_06975 [Geminicoccaceae bacterium]